METTASMRSVLGAVGTKLIHLGETCFLFFFFINIVGNMVKTNFLYVLKETRK